MLEIIVYIYRMIVSAVKTFIMIAVVALLAACATPPPTSSPVLPPTPPPPPLPVAAATLKRQTVKAFSVPAPASIEDRLGPNYGTVQKIPVGFEGGKKGWAVEVTWPNWPSTNAYSIQASTNLVDWTEVIIASPDPGRKIIIYDLEKAAYYRIVRAFVSAPQ